MIRYALVCRKRHEFESWFANSAAYDSQAERGLVTCPVCGTEKVEKALMVPRVARTDTPRPIPEAPAPAASETPAAEPAATSVAMMSPQEREFRQKLRELREHLVKSAENVGQRFPEEARKMHYGETERRSIFGVASPDDAKALHEEGIEFSPIPVLPDERN